MADHGLCYGYDGKSTHRVSAPLQHADKIYRGQMLATEGASWKVERPINFCIARGDKLVYCLNTVAMTAPASRDATQLRSADTPMNTLGMSSSVQTKKAELPSIGVSAGRRRRE